MMGTTNLGGRAATGRCMMFWLLATVLSSLQIGCHGFETVALTGRLEGATLQYQINEADPNANGEDTITIILEVPSAGWVGFGFNDNGGAMIGSEAVVGMPDEGTVLKYGISRRAANGFFPLESQTLINPMLTQTDETTTLEFTKLLIEDGEIPILKDAENTFLSAWGADNTFAYHAQRAPYTVFLQVGDGTPSPGTPISGNGTVSPAPITSPAPTPAVDCVAECATAIEDADCNAWFLQICLEDESSICSNSNETQPCADGSEPDCICDNPPPECEPCEEVVGDIDNCFFDYIHSCAATPIFSLCTNNETLIDACPWGACTCDNPPPECEPCEDVVGDIDNCFNDYIVTCYSAPIVTVCTNNASIGLQCQWGGCVCDNAIPSCPNCTDVLQEARCRGRDTHAHWCAGLDEPLCTESNSTPAEECAWGDWCPACGTDGSTFAPTFAPPTTPAPVGVTPAPATLAPVTPAPVDMVDPTMPPVDNTTDAPVDNTTDAPVDTPVPATDPPDTPVDNTTDAPVDTPVPATDPPVTPVDNTTDAPVDTPVPATDPPDSPVFITEVPVETEPPATEPPATDPPAGAPGSSATSYYFSKSVITSWFAIHSLALVAYMMTA